MATTESEAWDNAASACCRASTAVRHPSTVTGADCEDVGVDPSAPPGPVDCPLPLDVAPGAAESVDDVTEPEGEPIDDVAPDDDPPDDAGTPARRVGALVGIMLADKEEPLVDTMGVAEEAPATVDAPPVPPVLAVPDG